MSGRGTGHLACPCVPCRKGPPTAAEPMGHLKAPIPGVPDLAVSPQKDLLPEVPVGGTGVKSSLELLKGYLGALSMPS